jgi:peptidoglycan hydrolase CwlO-like protein
MEITDIVIPAITSSITFFLGIQRGKKEVDGLHLQNLEKSVQIYQTIINDLKSELESLQGKVDELQVKVDIMMKENDNLKKLVSKRDLQRQTK